MTKKLTPALISSHLKTIVLGCWSRFHCVLLTEIKNCINTLLHGREKSSKNMMNGWIPRQRLVQVFITREISK